MRQVIVAEWEECWKPSTLKRKLGLHLHQSTLNQPAEILEGKGAVAIRTLAHLKAKRDRQPFIWVPDMDWNYTVQSWADFTYALLEKLVKDEVVADTLRCKLFARDLGL
ncbi:hypothetical protein KW869_05930 [Pseudomonas urmiensis]|uniref:Uncharacterized protein n=1 Tax=Pseudomonas urmiensis TaxID=2745493 RepID=A0ABW8NSX1_9PSED